MSNSKEHQELLSKLLPTPEYDTQMIREFLNQLHLTLKLACDNGTSIDPTGPEAQTFAAAIQKYDINLILPMLRNNDKRAKGYAKMFAALDAAMPILSLSLTGVDTHYALTAIQKHLNIDPLVVKVNKTGEVFYIDLNEPEARESNLPGDAT